MLGNLLPGQSASFGAASSDWSAPPASRFDTYDKDSDNDDGKSNHASASTSFVVESETQIGSNADDHKSLYARKPYSARSTHVPSTSTSRDPAVPIKPSMRPRLLTSSPNKKDWLDRYERFVPWCLLLIAMFTRFYHLDQPGGVVFDETHFGRFTGQYHAGTYLFDIHPPLGKLVFWFVGKLVGYDYTKCKFVNITDVYGPECKYIFLRATSATYGSLVVPILYFIIRNWGGSIRAGILAGLLLTFDGLNLGEARLILMDAQLIFWTAACLLAAQHWWKRLNAHYDAEEAFFTRYGIEYDASKPSHVGSDTRFMSLRDHLKWLVLMGFLVAQSVAIKWTGLATPGMIAIESFFGFFYLKRPVKLPDGAIIAAVAFVVYAFYFWMHFWLLPYTGDGDGFMRVEFQKTLVNNTFYDATAPKPPFLVSFFQLNAEMLSANARITQRHHWESYWWEWPLNLRGILYYSRDMGHSYTQSVYLLGNPLVIWLVAASLAVSVGVLGIYWRYRRFGGTSSPEYAFLDRWNPTFTSITFCICAYIFNLLPYVAVTRSCFAYHYMPALLYGELLTALLVDALAGHKYMRRAMIWLLVPITAAFLFYSPWIYSTALTSDGHARRRWLKRWD